MAVQFTSCPACGAVGEIGSACQFCGTTIVQKEGVIATNSRIVNVRTVSPQEYANKIAIYRKIESYETYSIVSIGDQVGVINLNGDLVYPLGKHNINYESKMVVKVWLDARILMSAFREEIYLEHEKYVNLETLEESFGMCFVKDKTNPLLLHRLLTPKTWNIENTYTNIKGETHKYDYATCIYRSNITQRGGIYLFHKDNGCALWISDKGCILENVKSADEPIWKENKSILPIELMDGRKVEITLTKEIIYSNGEKKSKYFKSDDIYAEWSKKTGFDLPLKTEEPSPEEPSPEVQEKESSFSCIFQVLIMLIILLGIAWWKGWI